MCIPVHCSWAPFTGGPSRILYATDAISANIVRELPNCWNRESVHCLDMYTIALHEHRSQTVWAYTTGILEFSILTAFHRLSLLHFPLLHFPPLLSTPAFSTPAFSTPALYSRIFHSCIFHSRIFSAPSLWLDINPTQWDVLNLLVILYVSDTQ